MKMRITILPAIILLFLSPAALLAQAGPAADSQPAVPATTMVMPDADSSNFADFGIRGTHFGAGSDSARFQRYRDLRNGPTLDLFRYGKETDARGLKVEADHLGYRDQRYSASYDNYGRLKVSFEWNQIPLFYSRDTATLFTSASPGILRIDDGLQSGIQNNTTTLVASVGQARAFELRDRRDVLSLALTYSATQALDLHLSFKNTNKNGSQPWAGTFGFSNAVELAVPLDTRTTELETDLEWTNSRGLVRLGYDGSFFRNSIAALTWDNPLRIADSPTAGPSQGRMALWPSSDMNAASATGLLNLPWRSRATAFVSLGSWSQNAPLIPFTINSALPAIALDRETAEAQARVTATAYAFTSKPTSLLWFSARYRSYDFDNHTPVFHLSNTVAYDTSVAAFAEGGTSPYSLNRRTFDADASLTPAPHTAFRVGYTREQIRQTFRTFDTTAEDTVRLSADAMGIGWLTFRGVYEHGRRTGSGLDDQVLDDIGEQVSLRQFDISDRTSDRFSGIVQLTPVSSLSFSGTAAVGKEARPGTVFGLRSNHNHTFSAGVDFVPREAVSMGLSYDYERYDALQASRQANPGVQFDDPTRDWTTDGADRARTLNASIDLIKLWAKTNVRFAYDHSHAESVYVYGLPANSSLPPVVQLPAVINTLQRGTVDVRYQIARHLALGGGYAYDSYRVDDFALGAQPLTTLAEPSFLILGSLYRPYTASTVSGRLTYLW